MQQPVRRGGGKRLGNQLVEPIWGWGMFVVEDSGWCPESFSSGALTARWPRYGAAADATYA